MTKEIKFINPVSVGGAEKDKQMSVQMPPGMAQVPEVFNLAARADARVMFDYIRDHELLGPGDGTAVRDRLITHLLARILWLESRVSQIAQAQTAEDH